MMVSAAETQSKKLFSFNNFSVFFERYNTKFLRPGPIFEMVCVSTETFDESLFVLMIDIKPLVKDFCAENFERNSQAKLQLKTVFNIAEGKFIFSKLCGHQLR